MGLFYRTDGLTSYYTDDGGDVKERSHTTAYTQSGSTLEHTEVNIINGGSGTLSPITTGIWFSSDGTKLYILWTNIEYYDSDDGYMEQFSLSTAWDLSTVNSTPVTTLTLPKGTEYPYYPTTGTALYSDYTAWMGLEWADDGLSFYFIRYEADNYVSGVGRDSVSYKVDYTVSSAWNLSTASLSSTTKISISESSGFESGFVSMYHTMTGGEIVIAKGNEFMNLDSITDTTANNTSSLGSTVAWFFSEDETLLLGNGTYTCAATHVKIDTNYVQVSLTAFSSSVGNKNSSTACGYSVNQTYYHDGSGSSPTVGDKVYSDSGGTTPLAGGTGKHYKTSALGNYKITGSVGEVASLHICS